MEKKEKDFRQPNITVTILKAAQDEISSLDILVCGTCQLVYHFVEEFKEHKAKKNCGASLLRVNISESKPQVWAFLLWKNSLPSKEKSDAVASNSWHLYQRWCKIPQSIRESWISAGRTIQSFTTLAKSKVNDLPRGSEEQQKVITVTMRPTDDLDDDSEDTFDGFLRKDSDESKNEKNITQLNNSICIIEDTKIKDSISIKNLGAAITKISSPNVGEPLNNLQTTEIKEEKLSEDEIEIPDKNLKTNSIKRTPLGNEEILNTSEEEGEFVVEKILAKRFNPRRKSYEYLLKWEGYPAEQNTWEPVENMAACDKMVESFEQNLARQKQMQMKTTKGKVGRPRGPSLGGISKFQPIIESTEAGPSGVPAIPGRRPVRSSKAKALEQVKNWCGTMARKEGESGKRGRTSDSEDDEEDEKKIKLEPPDMAEWSQEDSDDSTFGEKKKKKGTGIRGRKPGTTVNGVAKRDLAVEIGLDSPKKPNSQSQQQPVLVANSKGVLKVDPRQVSNFTSGVYIVSNKTGVVKLSDKPTVIDTTKLPQSGIIRKPGTAVIQRTSTPGRPGGLFKLTSPKITKPGSIITRPVIPGAARVPLVSPRILGSRVGLTPGIRPAIRATTAPLVRKNAINIPGITTKITSAVKPKGPGRPPVKPIQSLLGSKNSASIHKIIGKKKESEEQPASPKKDIFDGFEDDSSDDDGFDSMPDFPMEDLGPIKPDSPPRPLTLCPITGKILSRAEGEPTPPPSPDLESQVDQEIKDEYNEETMYKVEMSPGGTTGMVINADIDDPAILETLRETHGITVVREDKNLTVTKIDDSKDASEDTNDSSTNTSSGGGGINLPARKLFVDADGMHVNSENSEGGEIVTITGEDGIVYHLASSGDGTQSDLSNGGVISVDSEGRQCVYVTAEPEEQSEGGEVLTLDTAVAEAVAQLLPEQVVSDSSGQIYVKNEPMETNDSEGQEQQQIIISEGGDDTTQAEIVAQIVQDDLIAGEGGTRRVVLLLPDGNLMMTEVDQDQYEALDLGK